MTTGNLEPMSKMTDWEWKETMLRGCGMIDQYLKDLERPHINPEVMAKAFPGITEHLPLLAKPARRETEVLVYSPDKKWWRQPPIAAGNTTGKIYLGNENTSGGTEFPVVVLTTEKRLTNQTYPNIPDHRTKAECVLTRG